MQVSDNGQNATSATLGAKKSTALTMVEDASFFHMLSSNLYSNQTLAAIREPLCNAWDAHIEAGTTHIPIEITITNDLELIIRDSGLGIADDRMNAVYGIYGGSTKKNNNNVTGGFGLGCKAPYAYVDSFRVTSEHKGVKTVYNMVKSCVELEGKPGIIPVVTTTTDRSGLTVQFPIQEEDVKEIVRYIKSIVLNGEMNATLLCERDHNEPLKLSVLGMSQDSGSYNYDDTTWFRNYMGEHRIFIRYGSVIYPMLDTGVMRKISSSLIMFMNRLQVNRILLQAEPGTLALTPSRESLSNQKLTEDGLTNLFVDVVDKLEKNLRESIHHHIEDLENKVQNVVQNSLGFYSKNWNKIMGALLPTVERNYLFNVAPNWYNNLYAQCINLYLKFLKKELNTFYSPNIVKALIRELKKPGHYSCYNSIVSKSLFYKLAKLAINHPEVEVGDTYLNEHFNYPGNKGWRKITGRVQTLTSIGDFIKEGFFSKPVIFLTPRIASVWESVKGFFKENPTYTHKYYLTYKVSKGTDLPKLTQLLKSIGIKVVDMTIINPWDAPALEAEKARLRKLKKAKEEKKLLGIDETSKSANVLSALSEFIDQKGTIESGTGTHKYWKPVISQYLSDFPSIINSNLIKQYSPKNIINTPALFIELEDIYTDTGDLRHSVKWEDIPKDLFDKAVLVRNGHEKRMAISRGAVNLVQAVYPTWIKRYTSKEAKRYFSRYRKKTFIQSHSLNSESLHLFKLLDIPLKGYDKMAFNKEFERLSEIFSRTPIHVLVKELNLSEDEKYSICLAEKVDKENPLPFIKMLNKFDQSALAAHMNVISYARARPQHIPAIKTLVKQALKEVKVND